MRKEFCEVESKEEAEQICPWAVLILPAEGGFWCFESSAEAEMWENQE